MISVTHFVVSSINCGMYNYQLDRHNFGTIGRWPSVAALSPPTLRLRVHPRRGCACTHAMVTRATHATVTRAPTLSLRVHPSRGCACTPQRLRAHPCSGCAGTHTEVVCAPTHPGEFVAHPSEFVAHPDEFVAHPDEFVAEPGESRTHPGNLEKNE